MEPILYDFLDTNGNLIDSLPIGENNPEGYIGQTINGVEVGSVVPGITLIKINRREERAEVFSTTLDIMNPLWYNTLTDEQQTELATWRQAWLDYPETGVRPADLEGIFN